MVNQNLSGSLQKIVPYGKVLITELMNYFLKSEGGLLLILLRSLFHCFKLGNYLQFLTTPTTFLCKWSFEGLKQ